MSQEYCRAALRLCVAQLCQHLGWNSIHSTPMELLTDILERYLLQIAKTTHRYSEQFGRTDVRIEDVFIALEHMGIAVSEIGDYIKHVEPVPFAKEVVAFPVPCENDLKFPNPESKEVQQRKVFEYIPEHLPYMHPELNEEEEEDKNQSAVPGSPERLVEPQVPEQVPSPVQPSQGEKRPVPSPGESPLPFKRPRLTTSQPLPEEASHSQYEMTSVMMTQSGILSSMAEGKVADSKKPPVGIKQNVIIVRQKPTASSNAPVTPGSKLPGETNIIRLDFNKDPSKGGKIVPVDNDMDSGSLMDAADPEYKPKGKKKIKELKRDPKTFKAFKRGPGRPRSPGRAGAVVHNKNASDFRIPKIGERPVVPMNSEGALDLSMKPVPPAPNINVVKFVDKKEDVNNAPLDFRTKAMPLSEQQERDMEDTIKSVIGGKGMEFERKLPEYEVKEHTVTEIKDKKPKKTSEEWTVSQISESYSPDEDDGDSDPHDIHARQIAHPLEAAYPPPVLAPHLQILHAPHVRPRGRPRGSTSGFYRTLGRSPMGRRPGRPPLRGKSPLRSPGRPPLTNKSPGRPPLSRSPGMSRSPGRPPLNRSPGRPPLNRSPGRPKGSSGLSPKPRGRPRGSKSPRNRGASPRGGSPRAPSSFLPVEESREDTSSTKLFKFDDDSGATLFDFPTKSPLRKDPVRPEISPVRSPSPEDKSPVVSSPAPTEPALSRENTPDLDSPRMRNSSPDSDIAPAVSVKRETISPGPKRIERSPQKSETQLSRDYRYDLMGRERLSKDREKIKQEEKETIDRRFEREREFNKERDYMKENRERDFKDYIREREHKEYKEREHKEYHKEREYKESRERELKDYNKEREPKDYRERDRETDSVDYREFKEHKERSREREHKEHREYKEHREHKEREHKEHKEHKDHREREHKEHKEREHKEVKEREHKEHKEREHKEHRDKEHSREREHKEHREREHKEHREREHKEHREREHKEHREREHKEHREREHKEHSREREHKEHGRDRDKSKEHRKDKKKKKKKNKDKDKERDEGDKERKEKHKSKEKLEKEPREMSPSVQPLQIQKLKIKFGGGSVSSPGSFSISSAKPAVAAPSPKPEPASPLLKPEMTVPKLKFKMLPPNPDVVPDGDSTQSWVSSIEEQRQKSPTPKREPLFSSPKVSPKPSPKPLPELDSDSDDNTTPGGDDEVTVSVVKGKIITTKKPAKRGKQKGSTKKGKSKGESSSLRKGLDKPESLVSSIRREIEKEGSPISPAFSPQNVPSPITIPALKAAPPPPSPPTTMKKSPPKPKSLIKEQRPHSPLFKEMLKTTPETLPTPKVSKLPSKSPGRKPSPKKSPKVSPTSKKKSTLSPAKTSPTKLFPFMDFQVPRTPSPRRSPSESAPASPMYSPTSTPPRDSPLHFTIPPTPAFPTRTHSPPLSPPSRQLSEDLDTSSRHLSTDDEIETPTPTSDRPKMLPAALPPMPPTSAQRRAQRSIITETVGSFVNECGEKVWICPACTMQDDGSPMIGCDKCDDWYHWLCVGIKAEPDEEESWFCPKCTKPSKSKASKRGRKKKKV